MKAGIAGAGLVGRLLALQLIKSGWQVTVFDRDDTAGNLSCAMTAAGMLTPLSEIESSDHTIYELGEYSLKQWPHILKQLNQSVYFQQNGSLITAHPQDHEELYRYRALMQRKLTQHDPMCQILHHEEILALEPEIQTHTALFFPSEGQLATQELMTALHSTLLEYKVRWHEKTHVTAVTPYKISTDDSTKTFDMVFDCRGLGAKSNFSTLRGIRGEIIWLHAPAVTIRRPVRLLHPRYRLYIVPRPNHIYIIGSSEIESEDMSEISVRSTLEFLSAAYSLHAGFVEARILKTLVNCRPALPNNLPEIKYSPGMMAINGLYRHGFLIAPALIDNAMKILTSKELSNAQHYTQQ